MKTVTGFKTFAEFAPDTEIISIIQYGDRLVIATKHELFGVNSDGELYKIAFRINSLDDKSPEEI